MLELTALFVSPRRIAKVGALVKQATLFRFHQALVNRNYRVLFFSSSRRRKPGPKGTSAELIAAIVEMTRRNPRFGCLRIAQKISHGFRVLIDKDVVRRVLVKHYRPGGSDTTGPSWLIFIAHAKDNLWSIDLFRCESILLRSHWLILVMDVSSCRIVGFGVESAGIRRRLGMQDVQSCQRRPAPAQARQYRPRPAVSIPLLARQSAHPRDRGNQVRSIRSALASHSSNG